MPITTKRDHGGTPRQLQPPPPRQPCLPVLILPGFMSSGLYVEESALQTSWTGKRLWLNLASLGLQTILPTVGTGTTTNHNHSTTPANNNTTTICDNNDANSIRADQPLDPSSSNDASPEQQQQQQQNEHKNLWLQHMSLQSNMQDEHDGIRVRNISGLAGIDYLTPGVFTNHLSYVFGPMIRALQAVGYREGKNLQAAPYDWRLSPAQLEQRDAYFSQTAHQVEQLYANNQSTPVVLVCHSLGCKVGHYFLNHCQQHKGQDWIDRHIHTYMPIGGPHLGAPKALRSCITGDTMGLDAFLSAQDARRLGRSFGSTPWLFPKTLPPDAPPVVVMRSAGSLRITLDTAVDTTPLLTNRKYGHRPTKLKLKVVYGGTCFTTRFYPMDKRGHVRITEAIVVRTRPDFDSAVSKRFMIGLAETGIGVVKKSKGVGEYQPFSWKPKCGVFHAILCPVNALFFFWFWWPFVVFSLEFAFRFIFVFFESLLVMISWCVSAGGGTAFVASYREKRLSHILLSPSLEEGSIATATHSVQLTSPRIKTQWYECWGKRETVPCTFTVTWNPPPSALHMDSDQHCSIANVEQDNRHSSCGRFSVKSNASKLLYDHSACGSTLLRAEELDQTINMTRSNYDSDVLDPRGHSSAAAPPVRRVYAIYGCNLPTEVGAVYKRKRAAADRSNHINNWYETDSRASMKESPTGYIVDGGVIKETKDTPQLIKSNNCIGDEQQMVVRNCSGDGTVPYWSLQHVRTWACDELRVDELEEAEHREILADSRLHKALIDYVTTPEEDERVTDKL